MANGTITNQRFAPLLRMGKFISFVGWVAVIVGAIMFLYGLSQLGERRMFGSMGTGSSIAGLAIVVNGLILAAGQIISCFVAIEGNTYDTTQVHRAILSLMEDRWEKHIEIPEDKMETAKSDKSATKAQRDSAG